MKKNIHNVRVNVKLPYKEISESELHLKRMLIRNYVEKVMNTDDVSVFLTVEDIPDVQDRE